MAKAKPAKTDNSNLVTFRCPPDLLALLDAAGPRTEVILGALEVRLRGDGQAQARRLLEEMAERLGVKL